MSDQAYSTKELAVLAANKKTPKPMINLPSGAVQISDEVENWLILQPNEAKKLLIWLIDETLKNHAQVSEIEQRLMKELADTSSQILKQRLWVLDEQTKGISSLTGYYQAGLSATGEITAPIPQDMLKLLNLVRFPIQNVLSQRDGYDYEVRLNTYLVANRAKNDYLAVDSQILNSWKNLVTQYTTGLDAPIPSMATIANNLASISTTPTYMKNDSAGDRKINRDLIIQIAKAQSYPANRLLAQIYQESKYVATAINKKTGAAGLGQFLKKYGSAYGMVEYPDDFIDPKKSIIATIRFMRDLQKQVTRWGVANETESWKIALASYNYGSGSVRKIINLNGFPIDGTVKLKWDDFSSGTPVETQNYVRLITQMEGNPP